MRRAAKILLSLPGTPCTFKHADKSSPPYRIAKLGFQCTYQYYYDVNHKSLKRSLFLTDSRPMTHYINEARS